MTQWTKLPVAAVWVRNSDGETTLAKWAGDRFIKMSMVDDHGEHYPDDVSIGDLESWAYATAGDNPDDGF